MNIKELIEAVSGGPNSRGARSVANGMHRFYCQHRPHGDYAGRAVCELGELGACAEFRSMSAASVIADQLRTAGWSIMVPASVPGTFRDVKHITDGALTFCPGHRPPTSAMSIRSG